MDIFWNRRYFELKSLLKCDKHLFYFKLYNNNLSIKILYIINCIKF